MTVENHKGLFLLNKRSYIKNEPLRLSRRPTSFKHAIVDTLQSMLQHVFTKSGVDLDGFIREIGRRQKSFDRRQKFV